MAAAAPLLPAVHVGPCRPAAARHHPAHHTDHRKEVTAMIDDCCEGCTTEECTAGCC